MRATDSGLRDFIHYPLIYSSFQKHLTSRNMGGGGLTFQYGCGILELKDFSSSDRMDQPISSPHPILPQALMFLYVEITQT